jgi:hypothetical protein
MHSQMKMETEDCKDAGIRKYCMQITTAAHPLIGERKVRNIVPERGFQELVYCYCICAVLAVVRVLLPV